MLEIPSLRLVCARIVRLLLMVPIVVLAILLLAIVGQDFILFPRLLDSLVLRHIGRDANELPAGVEVIRYRATDGAMLEVLRVSPLPPVAPSGAVALAIHGNGATVEQFLPLTQWFAAHGMTVYSPEFRGYGRSEGWPSVSHFIEDATSISEMIAVREKIFPSRIVPIGVSLGTGVATFVANSLKTRQLLLISPYASLKNVVASRATVGFLSHFLWNNLETTTLMSQLEDTCVVAVHARDDRIVPFENSVTLANKYRGAAKFSLIDIKTGGHGLNVFFDNLPEIVADLTACGLEL